MKKVFNVTVEFNLTDENVVNKINVNIDPNARNNNGSYNYKYTGNSKSTEKSAINGVKNGLSKIGFKNNSYKITKVEEI